MPLNLLARYLKHGEGLVPTADAAKMVLSPDVEVYSLLGSEFKLSHAGNVCTAAATSSSETRWSCKGAFQPGVDLAVVQRVAVRGGPPVAVHQRRAGLSKACGGRHHRGARRRGRPRTSAPPSGAPRIHRQRRRLGAAGGDRGGAHGRDAGGARGRACVLRVVGRYFRSFVDFASSGAVEEKGLVPTADEAKVVLSPYVEVYTACWGSRSATSNSVAARRSSECTARLHDRGGSRVPCAVVVW
ncbi:hypothetical protein EJB05_26719, partial [Eragrostis curvula]